MSRPTPSALSPLLTRWQQLAPREKNILAAALVLVVLALVWKLVLSPSLQTLRTSTAQAIVRASITSLVQLVFSRRSASRLWAGPSNDPKRI